MSVKNEKGESVIYEDKIYDWFTNKDNAALCDYAGKPFEFVRKVIRNVEHYINFTNGLGNDGKPSLAMDSLKRLAGGAFSLHYVLLLAAAPLPKPLFDHFVTQLESFLFYYIFTKTPTKTWKRTSPPGRMNCAALPPWRRRRAKRKDQRLRRRSFPKEHGRQGAGISDALKRFSLYSMQQYRTRYLLARLAQHVDLAFSGVKVAGSLEPYTTLEIEHILPDIPPPSCARHGRRKTEKPCMTTIKPALAT
jgi:hypothetical protein